MIKFKKKKQKKKQVPKSKGRAARKAVRATARTARAIPRDMRGAGDTGDPRQTTVPMGGHGQAAVHVLLSSGYNVVNWCSDGAGILPPEAVLLLLPLNIDGEELPPIALRLKSRRALSELIATLVAHRDDVWPKPMSDEEAMSVLIHRCEKIKLKPLEKKVYIVVTGATHEVDVMADEAETLSDAVQFAAQALSRGWPLEWGEPPAGYEAARARERADSEKPKISKTIDEAFEVIRQDQEGFSIVKVADVTALIGVVPEAAHIVNSKDLIEAIDVIAETLITQFSDQKWVLMIGTNIGENAELICAVAPCLTQEVHAGKLVGWCADSLFECWDQEGSGTAGGGPTLGQATGLKCERLSELPETVESILNEMIDEGSLDG